VVELEWDEKSKSIKNSNPAHKVLNLRFKNDFADLQSQLILSDDKAVVAFLKPQLVKVEPVELKKTITSSRNH
jgi:integrase/recombinase XerD